LPITSRTEEWEVIGGAFLFIAHVNRVFSADKDPEARNSVSGKGLPP
jgi:hypothetical protein